VTVFTVGHSTRSISDFIALLRQAAVARVVDVRAMPRSRKNPQFNGDALRASLAAAGIDYLPLPALGGRRRRSDSAPAPNRFWRNAAFRNYADYAASEAFRATMNELKALASQDCCAIMCAEAVWWRCHRRIIADYLLADGIEVAHILGPGKIEPATLTPGARGLCGGSVVYGSD
jgi:uncharacterized protein (DUF488 family)